MLFNFLKDYFIPLLTPLTTLVAGYFALRVYRNQKDDEKRNATNVIVLEIESAEEALKKVSVNKPYESQVVLMPTPSWDKYKHLLVSEFSSHRDEWDKITDFYSCCREYDTAVAGQNDMQDTNTKSMINEMQQVLKEYAQKYAEKLEELTEDKQRRLEKTKYKAKRDGFVDIYTGQITRDALIDSYTPQRFTNDAVHALETIDRNLSTSSAGQRLKMIAAQPKHTLIDKLLRRP